MYTGAGTLRVFQILQAKAAFDKFLLRRKQKLERTRLILSMVALFVMLSLLSINKSPNPCHMTRCDTVNKVITYYPLTGFQIVKQIAFDVLIAISSFMFWYAALPLYEYFLYNSFALMQFPFFVTPLHLNMVTALRCIRL